MGIEGVKFRETDRVGGYRDQEILKEGGMV